MPRRDRKIGKCVTDVLERKFEAISESLGVRDRLRQIAKEFAHFAIALQMSLGVLRQQFARGIEMGVLADAGENIEDFAPARRWRTARRWSR